MSNYIGYKPEDNFKRKENNTTDQLGWGPNNNIKAYSTKPGQMSMKSQSNVICMKQARLNRKQPVKQLSKMSPEEQANFLKKIQEAS